MSSCRTCASMCELNRGSSCFFAVAMELCDRVNALQASQYKHGQCFVACNRLFVLCSSLQVISADLML